MNEIEGIEGERLDLKLELSEGRRGREGGVWRIEAVASLEATHAWRNDASVRSNNPVNGGGNRAMRMRIIYTRPEHPINIQKLNSNNERLHQPRDGEQSISRRKE